MLLQDWQYYKEFLQICNVWGVKYPPDVGQSELHMGDGLCYNPSSWYAIFTWELCRLRGENLFQVMHNVMAQPRYMNIEAHSANCRAKGFKITGVTDAETL